MNLRSLLLAGAVFPFALSYPAVSSATDSPAAAPIVLAQSEEACPEGTDCAPAADPATEAAPAEETAPDSATETPVEEPAAEATPEQPAEAAAEEPAVESEEPAVESQAAPEEPAAATEAAPAAEAAAEEPAAGGANRRERALERARRQQERLEQGQAEEPAATEAPAAAEEAPAAEAPAAAEQAPAAAAPSAAEQAPADAPAAEAESAPAAQEPAAATGEAPAADQPTARQQRREQRARERAERRRQQQGGEAAAPAEPAAGADAGEPAATEAETAPEGESTVEQQLEAQGDQAEADRVRELRRKLRRERREAEANAPAEEGEAATEPDAEAAEGAADDERTDRRDRADRRRDRDRRERGRGEVVEQRGDRIIIDLGGGNLYVERTGPAESDRLLYGARDVAVEELPGGETRTIVFRENGSQIITVRNAYGEIITRTRVTPNGREVVLIDNRIPVVVQGGPPVVYQPLQLPPVVVEIPQEQYIVDLGQASQEQVQAALLAPPLQQLERAYTLEEVTRTEELRAYVPRIDLDTITFEFGSSTIGNDQMSSLEDLGAAMEEVIADNPDEVYLIEGHTDAVGSDNDNLILSDERAEAVAVALSQNFEIPPENLVTEGYGEQYLKVETETAERANRRVSVRRITELLSAEAQQ